MRTLLASANRTQTRVSSATSLMRWGSASRSITFRPCAIVTPTATKKMGVEIAVARAENVPHRKIVVRIRHAAPSPTAAPPSGSAAPRLTAAPRPRASRLAGRPHGVADGVQECGVRRLPDLRGRPVELDGGDDLGEPVPLPPGGHGLVETAQVQPATGGLELFRVGADHHEEGRAERGAAAQPQDH